jgi:hypothetical protein
LAGGLPRGRSQKGGLRSLRWIHTGGIYSFENQSRLQKGPAEVPRRKVQAQRMGTGNASKGQALKKEVHAQGRWEWRSCCRIFSLKVIRSLSLQVLTQV